MARPTILNDSLEASIQEYLNAYKNIGQVVPSVVGLCNFIGVSKSTIYTWKEDKASDILLDTLEEINEIQHIMLVSGGLSNAMNATIVKLMLSNHGYSEKSEIDNKSSDGSAKLGILNITITKPIDKD